MIGQQIASDDERNIVIVRRRRHIGAGVKVQRAIISIGGGVGQLSSRARGGPYCQARNAIQFRHRWHLTTLPTTCSPAANSLASRPFTSATAMRSRSYGTA